LRNALGSMMNALEVLRLQGHANTLAEQAARTVERQTSHILSLADQLSGLSGRPRDSLGAKAPSRTDCTEQPSKRRVLAVDDNRDAADSLGTLLVLLGHEVKIAYDGACALAAARVFRPDVCIVDLVMPGMDGFELALALRKDETLGDCMLVAMTG